MYRVRVLGLPYFTKAEELYPFFDRLAISRVHMLKSVDGSPLGAAVYFNSADDACIAAEQFHGRFFRSPNKPPRRLSVYGDEFSAKVVREEYTPEEPTIEGLRDAVHAKAVGGKWPRGDKYGMISHKNRYRRYKPPGNPKPRHG